MSETVHPSNTIFLDDLPKPSFTGLYLKIDNDHMYDKVMRRLEGLGWLWAGEDKLKPTEWHPRRISGYYPFSICLGYADKPKYSGRLIWRQEAKGLIVVDTRPVANLKTANTKPEATHCAACGGKLKDPGMGPTYKYCPKCEP